MRILLLSQWFPPEPMKLLSDLAEGLVSMGHEVSVLTGFPNWPAGTVYPGYRLRLVQREVVNGVRIIRIPLYPDHSSNRLKRAANFISFALSAAVLGPFFVPAVDVIHVVHPPITIGLPAWVLSRVKRVPFTLEINDMWPENLRSTGMVKNDSVLRMVGWFARQVYRRTRRIRVVSPGFRTNLLKKGVSGQKIRVISNWVDTDFYRPVPPSPELREQFGMSGCFNFLYAGTIGPAQDLETVLTCAEMVKSSMPNAQFVFAGDGIEYDRLRRLALDLRLTNVRFLGRLPGEMMPQLYACADVLLLHLRADPLFAITIPHKVFTYMAAAKPILMGCEGDAAAVVTGSGAGIAVAPGDPKALASAAKRLCSAPLCEREAMGLRGRQTACESYGFPKLLGDLAHMLENSVATGKAHA